MRRAKCERRSAHQRRAPSRAARISGERMLADEERKLPGASASCRLEASEVRQLRSFVCARKKPSPVSLVFSRSSRPEVRLVRHLRAYADPCMLHTAHCSRPAPSRGIADCVSSAMAQPVAQWPPNCRLFLGNLASEKTSAQELREIFGKYGRVVEEPVLRRSFGFIQYDNPEAAAAAIAAENGRLIGGVRLGTRKPRPPCCPC